MTDMLDGRGVVIPARCNLALAAAVGLVNLAALFGPPLLLAAGAGWGAVLTLLFVVATVPHWALIHEAVHGHLHPRPRVNEALGRALAILFAAPFDTLRFGHLSHHALNARPSERPECYDPTVRSRSRATVVFYVRLLFGVYLLELAASLLSLLPRPLLRPVVRRVFYEGEPDAARMADRAERVLLDPGTLARIRTDAVMILCLFGGAGLALGGWWPLLAAAVLGRGVVVSVLDNAPHYGGPLADPDQGFDTRVPAGLDALVLNSNLHGTHHRHPNLPWTALPAAFRAEGGGYAGSYLVVPLRQLKGPVPAGPRG